MTTKIYGYSDDLIEFEGDFYEEINFYPAEEGPSYIALSNGTVLQVILSHGWQFRVVKTGGNTIRIEPWPVKGEDSEYSDYVYVEEPVEWALLGEKWAVMG